MRPALKMSPLEIMTCPKLGLSNLGFEVFHYFSFDTMIRVILGRMRPQLKIIIFPCVQAPCQVELDNWVNSIHSACAAAFARHRGKTGTLHLLQVSVIKIIIMEFIHKSLVQENLEL